jgi:hypothetical protein
MSHLHRLLYTPAANADRLNASIVQFSDILLELTSLGLDQARHQPTPLQNKLLAAACADLEAWIEIQKAKLENAEREAREQQGGPVPLGFICLSKSEGGELFVPLDPCVLRTDGIQLGPQNPPTPV